MPGEAIKKSVTPDNDKKFAQANAMFGNNGVDRNFDISPVFPWFTRMTHATRLHLTLDVSWPG